MDGPVAEGTFAVVLTAANESTLAQVADRLRLAGVAFTAIFEPDEPHAGALMALGLRPARKEEIRRHLSVLPLLR